MCYPCLFGLSLHNIQHVVFFVAITVGMPIFFTYSLSLNGFLLPFPLAHTRNMSFFTFAKRPNENGAPNTHKHSQFTVTSNQFSCFFNYIHIPCICSRKVSLSIRAYVCAYGLFYVFSYSFNSSFVHFIFPISMRCDV